MMMFVDDAFFNLVDLFCKTCRLNAAGAPNNCRFPKCIVQDGCWGGLLLMFTPFVFSRVKVAGV